MRALSMRTTRTTPIRRLRCTSESVNATAWGRVNVRGVECAGCTLRRTYVALHHATESFPELDRYVALLWPGRHGPAVRSAELGGGRAWRRRQKSATRRSCAR